MKQFILSILIASSIISYGQTVTLTFTGEYANGNRIALDSVVITNLSRGWQEVLHFPDTTLILTNGVGIAEHSETIDISQAKPNPFEGYTSVDLYIPNSNKVKLTLLDMSGKTVCQQSLKLIAGQHSFRVSLSNPQTYILHIQVGKEQKSIKLINEGSATQNKIEYVGTNNFTPKSIAYQSDKPFVFGDFMEYVGYTTFNNEVVESNRINIQQGSSQTHILHFQLGTWDGTGLNPYDGLACAGVPVVSDYDGNIYSTVQIGTQCWMRENLQTTHYSNGTFIPISSTAYTAAAPYRYAPGNDTANVVHYGYYYNWPAIMNGSQGSNGNPSNIQGICPTGWHLPSSAEWNILTTYVGAQNIYECGNSSTAISKSLSAAKEWIISTETCATGNDQGNNNATGFSALPAGGYSGTYNSFGNGCCFWTCTSGANGYAVGRSWYYNQSVVLVTNNGTNNGRSVRCLKD